MERVAKEETKVAKEQRQRAEQSELAARRNLYASDMLLAQHVQKDGNLDLTLSLLNRHRPAPGEADLRGWEWRYLWSMCQSDEVATFATNPGSLSHMVMSRDGTLLSTAEWGPARTTVRIWGFPSGQLIATPETNDALGSVAFSPNGRLLAFGTRSHGLKLWDIGTRQEVANFPGRYGTTFGWGLVFSPDGRTLAASGLEPEILLWSTESMTLTKTLKGHSDLISSLVFSPDGKTLVSGSADGTIRLWSFASGQEIPGLTNHTKWPYSLALSLDGRTLASGDFDKTIRIWDLEARRQIAVLTNHTRIVFSVAFSPDGKTLASGSADFLIKLWDTARWQDLSTLKGSLEELYDIAFSPDGKTLISGAKNGMIKTWNAVPQVHPKELPRDAGQWRLGDGMLFCIHTNGAISYWNPLTLRETARYDAPEGLMTNLPTLALTPGGKMVWSNNESEIVVWDLAVRRQLARLPWVAAEQKSFTVSPNEKLLVAAAAGKGLSVWDLEKLQEIASLPKSAAGVQVMRFSPDLRLVAAGNEDGTVEVWDLNRKERVADWQAHQRPVTGVAFMPDGKGLVTVSWDANAILWDIETRRELRRFTRTLNAFWSLVISPPTDRG
jgi:WD40 repeat protein